MTKFKQKLTQCVAENENIDRYQSLVPVDYIVSGDKDLLVLGNHAGIPIVSYNELQELLK